jgi:hypothetical protein
MIFVSAVAPPHPDRIFDAIRPLSASSAEGQAADITNSTYPRLL